MPPAIELVDVEKRFAGPGGAPVHALRGVSLAVQPGETLCLLGTSGSGKTTALKTINRLVEPDAGVVRVDGRDVREGDVIALRRGIGYVVQGGALFPHKDVAQNVALLGELEGWPRERRRARTAELLALVGLDLATHGGRLPAELSGGQRQRVGVARALFLDPPVLLMDEPFGALDPITRGEIHVEFEALEERVQKTIVLVTHDLAEAFRLGDRVAVFDRGRVVQVGTEAELREAPASDFVREFLAGFGAEAAGS